jgi:hypothetical protein
MVALESRLPAVLRGDDKPKDAAEGLEFAVMANTTKQFGASARLYAESLGADPRLAGDVKAWHRYNAACSAALAAAGKGDDQPRLDEPEKARWRKQALDWLRADLVFWTKQANTGQSEAKALVSQRLRALEGRLRPGRRPRSRLPGQAARERTGGVAGPLGGRRGPPEPGRRAHSLNGLGKGVLSALLLFGQPGAESEPKPLSTRLGDSYNLFH